MPTTTLKPIEQPHKQVIDEYLGDISSENLMLELRKLSNTNRYVNSIGEIQRLLVPGLFGALKLMVYCEFEYTWDGDPNLTRPVRKKFVGITIRPDETPEEELVRVPENRSDETRR